MLLDQLAKPLIGPEHRVFHRIFHGELSVCHAPTSFAQSAGPCFAKVIRATYHNLRGPASREDSTNEYREIAVPQNQRVFAWILVVIAPYAFDVKSQSLV